MDRQLTEDRKHDFTALWSDAYPVVAAYTASLVSDHHQTEEVLSRIAITVVRKFEQYDSARPFGAWAIGIARYEILKFRRERARDRHLFAQDLLETIGDRCVALSEETTSYGTALRECLANVQGRAATALALCYGENLHSDEIGRRMKMTSGAVRTMLHRARDVVRRCIEQRRKEAARP